LGISAVSAQTDSFLTVAISDWLNILFAFIKTV
jgi:hypothetical protein